MDSDSLPLSQTLIEDSQVQVFEKEYYRCILYNWRSGLKTPFKSFPKENYGPGEIREEWYKYQLKPDSRVKILRALKTFPEDVMSMFAKIEKGRNFEII